MATDVVARLRLRAENFSREVRKAFDPVPSEADRAGRAAGVRMGAGIGAGLRSALGGLAIGTVVREIAQVAQRAVEFGVELGNNARALNTNVEELQAYREAANSVGVANKVMDDGLQELFQSITKAAAGGKDQAAAFQALGISLVDTSGHARTTTAVMGEVVDKLSAIPDPLRQAQIGTELFGQKWRDIAPLLDAGSEGLRDLTDSILATGDALSTKEIQELNRINAEFERMQTTLERDISRAVAANADAIVGLGNALGWVAGKAVSAASALLQFRSGFANLRETRGWLEALNATPGEAMAWSSRSGAAAQTRQEAASIRRGFSSPQDYAVDLVFNRGSRMARLRQLESELPKLDEGAFLDQFGFRRGANGKISVFGDDASAMPSLPSESTGGSSAGGKPRGARAANDNSRALREQQRAAERLREQYARMEESLDRALSDQRDAAAVENLRAAGLERMADQQEALNKTNDRWRDIAGKTAKEVSEQLQVTTADAQELLDKLEQVRNGEVVRIDVEFDRRSAAAIQKDIQSRLDDVFARQNAEIQAAWEASDEAARRHFEDLSSFYFDLFDGNTRNIWDNFKRLGLNALAELAAHQTMKLLSGEKVDVGGSLKELFSAQKGDLIGGMSKGALASTIADAIGIRQSKTGAMVGSAIGSVLPIPFGGAIGGLLGGTIGGLFKKSKWGTAVLSGGADPSIAGNKATVRSSAGGAAGSVQDTLAMIANQLGGDVGSYNVSIGQYKDKWRVSTSGYTGKLKLGKNGVVDFGKEGQEEAIRYAIRDALADGAIRGISDASQRILRSGQDIEVALEKAVSIESIPKLLKARLDPLGAALDEIDGKFEKLAATLREGGGSAEQIAQARQLWQLERADAIAEIGQASAVLHDYLKTLRVGPDSPLSLRTQAADAEAAMAPYLAQIRAAEDAKAQYDQLTASKAAGGAVRDADIKAAKEAAAAAAAAIDQSGFRDSAALFLDVSRQLGGSTRAFFDQFDRIQGLTNSAIALVENAVPLRADEKDPFAALTAKSTEATAAILGDHTALLNGILNGIYSLGGTPGGSGFIGSDRGFIRAL